MFKINLNLKNGLKRLKALLKGWTDDKKASVPVVIVKISEAFSMYHQVSSANLVVHHHEWIGLHPVIINDLDTNNNVVLILNTNGVILHYYLINNNGQLILRDDLRKVASKTVQEEYLDYFYCIAKNIEGCVKTGAS